jgi:hypothetical protein
VVGVGLGGGRADGGGDHLRVALRDAGEHVAHEVRPTDSHCQLRRLGRGWMPWGVGPEDMPTEPDPVSRTTDLRR